MQIQILQSETFLLVKYLIIVTIIVSKKDAYD
jgi:hypothetical protein